MLITFSAATKQGGIANSTDDRSKAQWNQQAGTWFTMECKLGEKGILPWGLFIKSISLPWETGELKLKKARRVYAVGSDGSTSASESSLELLYRWAPHISRGSLKKWEKSEEGEREQEADSNSLLFCNMLETLYNVYPQTLRCVFCVHQFIAQETEGQFKEVIERLNSSKGPNWDLNLGIISCLNIN